MTDYLFYFFVGALTLLTLATLLTPLVLRSAIYLMGVLTLTSGCYFLLGAHFLGGVQILVYVGGIVVLLVFAVMLTNSDEHTEDHPPLFRKLMGLLAAIAFFGSGAYALSNSTFIQSHEASNTLITVNDLGRAFLDAGPSGYLLPFEVISLLLLTVLITGIVIAGRRNP